ncbi:MAG TPA: NAD-dependent epimerase/dehydratase family protein [Candidatus Limnocylindrales bacterium]|nr:NAD-dependent epimerase/dehydratase family protein [Candidatus Limnocylindrales bacterium]
MMQTDAILITGANGELGRALIAHLQQASGRPLVTLDVRPPDAAIEGVVERAYVGDILDKQLITEVFGTHRFRQVFHFAALLSTAAERDPARAHAVNVEGTLNLMHALLAQHRDSEAPAGFFYPSSIAVYGLPGADEKGRTPPINETQYLSPETMYGCNKRYCELVGSYYAGRTGATLDFRCLRYPGLISAETVPSGGTSDFGPEMLHAAAQGLPYAAFVRPDTTIPFMTMPDAVKALIALTSAPRERLKQHVYNVTAFSLSARDIAARAEVAFPGAQITYVPVPARQRILDSWPAAVDDRAARRDWGWFPDYDADSAFNTYLIPAITAHYVNKGDSQKMKVESEG